MAVIINASTSTGLVQSADTSGIIQFQSNGSTKATLNSSGFSYPGAVLQVVQTVKSDTFSASPAQGVFTDITGLSVSITPTSATSKILVFIDVAVASSNVSTGQGNVRLVRGSTPIYIGDAAGSRAQSIMSWPYIADPIYNMFRYSGVYLDSPATTSSTTYKYQIAGQSSSYTVYVNRNSNDQNRWEDPRVASSITVMEIAV
jgi:hypothetical protein